ncbi:G-type lectin S-receptor-like serine/threonine-protein kinase [Populus alba x Populus x berolinensis]|uniref:Receptor-like serine/threonine-protein kinase n=1 Tax=Populus alba x Populus x berolinensis TaxID=444605 RepID=A0AAD6Q5S3_9ROSI|nr:G-type lectin S-receptor-like serine/threonine-protein kinase [Populus alba x Populus x berolinensis]
MDRILAFLFIITKLLLFLFKFSTALDSISPSAFLIDGKTLVSDKGTFELGFFSPGISKKSYLGIWYKNIPDRTIVWVANRLNPINDSSGLLKVANCSDLVLLSNSTNTVVWSSNSTKKAKSPLWQLLDSGNLVLRDKDDGSSGFLWQSFDYPCDTMLPGMKIGWDLRAGLDRRLSSWKSSDDPSPGDFKMGLEQESNPEVVAWKGSKKQYRSGPWNGVGFSGSTEFMPNPVFDFTFVSNNVEVYYTFNLKSESTVITRSVLNHTTYDRQCYTWNEEAQTWELQVSVPRDRCDNYGLCGANANCIFNATPVCQCLETFKPKSPEEWNNMDWSQGCVRNKELDCQKGDGFIKFDGLKLPDATHSWVNKDMNLQECKAKCLVNCSCMAYSNLDIRGGGSGCANWFGDLMDIRLVPGGGQELYIRMHASEIGDREAKAKMKIAAIATAAFVFILGILTISYHILKEKAKFAENDWENDKNNGGQREDMELPLFAFSAIADATNNFSVNNKLGEGGFGPVYRGKLEDGQEIAVKRLSRRSGQGFNEFKNEVILINKLQHRNLVKLLGCCSQREEKMLIYEYMPNRSLDSFIFDETKGRLLDWSRRFNIISGIARGLLYLHQDSRLRIIHRDLKASNVLLDDHMNPKISDFGLARMFVADQTEGDTSRVVGTYGYMAPEYATDGLFSVKSDVFSFGVLLLEIISGKKSKGFYHPDHSLSLIGHTWRLWNEGDASELIDALRDESCNPSEVLRCVHISLLCVQQHPDDRPSMASVVWMLGGDSALPNPKEPAFLNDRGPLESSSSSNKVGLSSTNEITVSVLEPR